MLHHDVEIVVRDEVLNYLHGALLGLTKVLQLHCTLDLHHDALLEIHAALFEVFKLLDKEEGLGEFILGNIGFYRR